MSVTGLVSRFNARSVPVCPIGRGNREYKGILIKILVSDGWVIECGFDKWMPSEDNECMFSYGKVNEGIY